MGILWLEMVLARLKIFNLIHHLRSLFYKSWKIQNSIPMVPIVLYIETTEVVVCIPVNVAVVHIQQVFGVAVHCSALLVGFATDCPLTTDTAEQNWVYRVQPGNHWEAHLVIACSSSGPVVHPTIGLSCCTASFDPMKT